MTVDPPSVNPTPLAMLLANNSPEALPRRPSISRASVVITVGVVLLGLGIWGQNFWVTLGGTGLALAASLPMLLPVGWRALVTLVTDPRLAPVMGVVGVAAGALGLVYLTGNFSRLVYWFTHPSWDAVGAFGEGIVGAFGQLMIALLALYVAWRQYVIETNLTTQQNRITQQQTIDTYFQGISDLVLDEQGLLEDWPQERAIAEGRTAAILSSVDAQGKAKILRFLSHSGLLTPLKRDRRLGRAILDGTGGYMEEREEGVRVIDLRVMLAGADLAHTDLRWTDISDANLVGANLGGCDLVKANLARTVLFNARLQGADLDRARLFYGSVQQASPRSRTVAPDYTTGAHTGAVVENADFTGVKHLSEEQRYYCCAWGGPKTRLTVPGGCEGIPNKLTQPASAVPDHHE